MTDVFKIRFQLVQVHEGEHTQALDSFLIDVPEHVWGVSSSKSEAPYLVARAFFERMKERFGK
jgi:hypothetical protein